MLVSPGTLEQDSNAGIAGTGSGASLPTAVFAGFPELKRGTSLCVSIYATGKRAIVREDFWVFNEAPIYFERERESNEARDLFERGVREGERGAERTGERRITFVLELTRHALGILG